MMFCTTSSVLCKNGVTPSNVKIRRLYGLVHAIKSKWRMDHARDASPPSDLLLNTSIYCLLYGQSVLEFGTDGRVPSFE